VTTCTSARSRASSVSIPISSGVPIYLLSQWHANRRADALHDISSRRNLQVTTLAYSENGTLPSLGVTEGQYGPALTLLANYMAGSFVTAAMAAHRSRKGKPGSRCWHIRERDNVGDRPMTSLSAVQRSVRSEVIAEDRGPCPAAAPCGRLGDIGKRCAGPRRGSAAWPPSAAGVLEDDCRFS
jgi:hypothetical protein